METAERAVNEAPAGSHGLDTREALVGCKNFVRRNPMSDRFAVEAFHHVEFWTSDATNTASRFAWGLGMTRVAASDLSTGNSKCASYVLQSNELVFVFTAPYIKDIDVGNSANCPFPGYGQDKANAFIAHHGLAVRAIGLKVQDAAEAYRASVANGAIGVLEPTVLRKTDRDGAEANGTSAEDDGSAEIAEVVLYGDVVLRYVSTKGGFKGPFLPKYAAVEIFPLSYGLRRLDHAVGNVPELMKAIKHIAGYSGFHEFAEFTAEDVGTVDSGLNSMVLASNNELVLLPINEPTFGTKRKSQIQTYLEHNGGPGLQHLALMTDDIFRTLREMRQRSFCGGFDFMPRPSAGYYKSLPAKVGASLTAEQLKEAEELGILVDKDDQGVLLQIFTKPIGDRPTAFLEIIQRVGCMYTNPEGKETQKGGCGGFGKGNFSELFKSIEDYERTLDC